MRYEIFVDYTTGDSFGNEKIEGEDLGVIVDSQDLAEKALYCLEEHYKATQAYDNAYHANSAGAKYHPEEPTKEGIKEDISTKDWFVNERGILSDGWQWCVSLQINNEGERVTISVPYVGYFERLERVYAQPLGNTLSISF